MPNRLQYEKSPYLRQHADNPVDWYPWGEEAFEKARRENKPVFLSIGYATCHWCHVMARESFADEEVAAELNRDYRDTDRVTDVLSFPQYADADITARTALAGIPDDASNNDGSFMFFLSNLNDGTILLPHQ